MKIIECPRDAMQGIENFIPTTDKIRYINQLLRIGFDTLDFGSFVSPKAMPQMRDTAEVLKRLDLTSTSSKLLAIIANIRGAKEALQFDEIHYLGFPLSISETFQVRNTNKTIVEALNMVEEIQNLCVQLGKEQVVYLSMGFGNPYNDPYNEDIVNQFSGILQAIGISTISLADTVGIADVNQISSLFKTVTSTYPDIEFGVHLHSNPVNAHDKIQTAYDAGCRRFDGAIKGFGGCPFADDKLVGNIPTELIVAKFERIEKLNISSTMLEESIQLAEKIFS